MERIGVYAGSFDPVTVGHEDIIRRAKFAQDPDAHMAGGLDKARRTGVTKPLPDEF